jgi:hypothetical protein
VIGARPPVEEDIAGGDVFGDADNAGEREPAGIVSDDVPKAFAVPVAVEAELIGEPPADEPEVAGAEIVDAEVVEPDLEQERPQADR